MLHPNSLDEITIVLSIMLVLTMREITRKGFEMKQLDWWETERTKPYWLNAMQIEELENVFMMSRFGDPSSRYINLPLRKNKKAIYNSSTISKNSPKSIWYILGWIGKEHEWNSSFDGNAKKSWKGFARNRRTDEGNLRMHLSQRRPKSMFHLNCYYLNFTLEPNYSMKIYFKYTRLWNISIDENLWF